MITQPCLHVKTKSKDLFRYLFLMENQPVEHELYKNIRIENIILLFLVFKGLETCGYIRFRFLLQSLQDLERQFASFGIHFMCFYGEPHQVLEKLIKVGLD
jgi:deoxyribodipyrimidine photolyase